MWLIVVLAISLVIGALYFLSQKKGTTSQLVKTSQSALKDKNRSEQLEVPLLEKNFITHDTIVFKFGLPRADQVLGLNVGEHICIHEQINTIEHPEGELVERKYTPISTIQQKGSFDLLIKIYRPNVLPQFPNGGKLTSWIENLKINENIHITGPYGRLNYLGNGYFNIKNDQMKFEKKFYNKIVMIAGGSGITPMYQIIQAVLLNQNDQTQLQLLFGNKTKEDILLYDELVKFAQLKNFKVTFTLDNPPIDWEGQKGFITKEMTTQVFGKLDSKTLALSCGPPVMNRLAMENFEAIGVEQSNYFKF